MLSILLSYNEKGTIVPQQIKVNLTNGTYLSRIDHEYIAAGKVGNECRSRCPRSPHYLCSRDRGHGGDHAAHGWAHGLARRLIVMYARWSQ